MKTNKFISKRKKLVIANWKMNPDNIRDAKKDFNELKKKNLKLKKSSIVICPPTAFIGGLTANYRGNKFQFGAQDASWSKGNKSTGEVSPEMLESLGVSLVIVGHSDRRAIGETDLVISKKIKRVIAAGLVPVLCIGENVRDVDGEYLQFIKEELYNSLNKITKDEASKLIIAYEPVWAVGKGNKVLSGHELHQMMIFVKKILSKIYNKKIALSIPILYGGSVDVNNCREIIDTGEVDGLLIGRASLNPHVFADILKIIEEKKTP